MSEISEENVRKSEELKNEANDYFKKQQYDKAIELYTAAIELNDTVAIYYGNRSFAYLRTECFGYALQDASKALELDKTYVKGYYRRASAYMSLGKFKLALKDYETVTKTRPNDRDAKLKFNECQKVVKMLMFQKAIAVDDDNKSVAQSIDLESMAIEDDYVGPRLEDGKVTEQFMKDLMEHYKVQRKLHRQYAYKILLDVREQMTKQPTLVDVTIPDDSKFTVCGDIHGQYYDLMNIFELNGLPSSTNPYLFNGDFVDRGSFSVECIFVLFGFKLLYPNHFFMSRGNHESVTMNQMYGFQGEVKAKYTAQMAELFTEVYNWLPLCHCLNNRILQQVSVSQQLLHQNFHTQILLLVPPVSFNSADSQLNLPEFVQALNIFKCNVSMRNRPLPPFDYHKTYGTGARKVMHGGLFSEDNVTLDDIRKTDRNRQPPEEGIMCELLWSDPMPGFGRAPSKRGVGIQFGPDVTKRFLEKNNLEYIIRSHEVKAEGYEIAHDGKCITVFSAPNYCDTMGNKGSFITMNGKDLRPRYTTYEAVPHPPVKPMAYANSILSLFS